MVRRIERIPETIPSLDCPAAPFVDDFEDKVIPRPETLAEQRPLASEALIKLSTPAKPQGESANREPASCRDESQRNGNC